LLAGDARPVAGKAEPALAKAFLSANRIRGHSQPTIVYSAVVHTIALAVVLLLPLWFTEAMDPGKFMTTLLAAPPQLMTAPAPPAAAAPAAASAQPTVRRIFMQGNRLLFPTAIPKHAAVISEGALEPEIGVGGVFGGVYGGVSGGLGSELLGAMGQPAPPPPPLTAEPVVEQPRKPLRVGGDVRPPKLIRQVDPAYPPLARQARVQGDIVLSAMINESGEVTELKAISGPPLLYPPALAAVRQWRFEPTYLNGRPWPIAFEITVHFRL
jgi:protein TonB